MAKKNEVRIPIKVDGKEILLTKKQVEKLNKSLDKTGISAHSADRRLKGAAQASSNTTKNFSKMAQGITGGLVPAYATLAANIFAISAAFRFLQSAGDLRILQQGQLEYAQRTGQNLAILTRQLQAATDGQLAFAEAAQSVAIGTAAGLSAKQINELGKVAKNASLMLGRDLTDSFNRLVRGAVKAEPELLDELGIILRLETAAEKYALSINKNAKQLNIFEKSQSVVNEVLSQGIEKFGGVETQTNSLTKLAKAFDDLVNSLKRAIGPMSEFMATALSQNTLATAGMGIFAGSSLLRAVTPSVPSINLGDEVQGMRERVSDTGMLNEAGKAKFGKLQTTQELKNFERSLQAKKSKFLDYTTFTKAESKRMVLVLKAHNLEMQADQGGAVDKMKNKFLGSLYLMQAEYGKFVGTLKFLGRGLSTAIRFAGYAGIIISLVGVIKQFFDSNDKAEQKAKAAQKEFGELFSKNAEDLEKMIDGLKTFDSLMTNALQSARGLSNIDFSNVLKGFEGGIENQAPSGAMGKIKQAFLGMFTYDNLDGEGPQKMYQGNFSADQIKGLEGIRDALKAEQKLLIINSDAYNQHEGIIKKINTALSDNENNIVLTSGAYSTLISSFETLQEEGTIAQNTMKGLTQTTQIMSSSAQDFSKALRSFKAPQTSLTRLTTNIQSVGGALSGLGEAFEKLQVKMNFKQGGDVFDSATMSMLSTFLSKEDMSAIDAYKVELNALAVERDKFEKDSEGYKKKEKEITAKGAEAFLKFGELTEKEAERLHGIEMKMIGNKTKAQTNLSLLTLGATKNQAKQLKMQSAIVQNNLNISNQETLLAELKKKGLTMDDAQVVTETAKLDLLKAQGMQLQANIDHQYQLAQAAKNSFESGLQGTFDDLITGKNSSLTEGLANIGKGVMESVSKQLSEQMATGVSNFLFGNKELEGYKKGAEILKQAHIDGIKAGIGSGTGDISSNSVELGGLEQAFNLGKKAFAFLNPFSAAKGGITPSYEKGGITPSYAKGGITPVYAASGGVFEGSKQGYPAIMHGNEAVVPLPDGKSIPVSGGMGGNVNVSVNMTTGATTTESTGSDMYMMGEAVASAVQNELEKQQRPGGMLSPY